VSETLEDSILARVRLYREWLDDIAGNGAPRRFIMLSSPERDVIRPGEGDEEGNVCIGELYICYSHKAHTRKLQGYDKLYTHTIHNFIEGAVFASSR